MRKLFTVVIILLIICYPFAIYFGINHFSPRYLALLIAIVLALRFLLLNKTKLSNSNIAPKIILVLGLVICLLGVMTNSLLMMKLYPVFVNILMLCVFIYSILNPPTIIEYFARLSDPKLPDAAISYIGKVTKVWCVFFLINALIATWTVFFASISVWTFYNGLLSYILMGILFGVEFIVRFFVKRGMKPSINQNVGISK